MLTILALLLFLLVNKLNFSECLNNGLALTPPMGWMHWERFRCVTDCQAYPDDCISENLFKQMADKMVEGGFLNAGYEYIIIDDCWSSKSRDANDRLQGDLQRFPNGIKHLADYVHDLGLKFGIYGDYGKYTCGGYPGSIDHLELDAQTFADWGVDYLKLDGCYTDVDDMEEGYIQMSNYLNNTGRPIAFSCSFPAYQELDANYSVAVEYCNLWRNYGDIDDAWEDVKDIANWFAENQDYLTQFAGPGHWNDPDMLIIGDFGLSLEESKSQMTIWSLLAAPLIMSVDLRTIEPEFRNILLNKQAISINQDPLGIPGKLLTDENKINIWKKPISSKHPTLNSWAIGFVSYRSDGYIYLHKFSLLNYGLDKSTKYNITDVFDPDSNMNNKVFDVSDPLEVRLKPSGAVLLMATPVQSEHYYCFD